MLEILDVNDDVNNGNLVSPTKIKVVGCGGCGGNAVNNMVDAGIKGVQFIALNTDLQHLSVSKADHKIQIGKKITAGLGAGMHPEIGEEAAKEEQETIKALLDGSDMIFITAGMGGGTGTGSAPIVAKIAREAGALTVAVVTTPFTFEGGERMKLAMEGIKKLRQEVDSLIVIPNQRVFEGVEKKPSAMGAFKIVDDILRQGVKGISEIITKTGLVNRDFKDVETVMKGQGDAILGIGVAEGENRAVDAATAAISNRRLADTHIDGAKNILIKISGNEDVGIDECDEIVKVISASADKNVKILWGLYIESELEDKISVTVVATGFNSANSASQTETVEQPVYTEPAKDSEVVDINEFDSVLNPEKILTASPVAERAQVSDAEISSLFNKANTVLNQSVSQSVPSSGNGNLFDAMKAAQARNVTMNMPSTPIDTKDLSQPTAWRNLANLSNSIDVTKK